MALILTLILLYISKVLPSLSGIILYSAPDLHIENCTPSICKDVLDSYLMDLDPEIQLVRNSQTLIVGFLHPKPRDEIALSLAVKIHLLDLKLLHKDNYKEEYPNHCNTKDDGVELTIEFPNFNGCNYIVTYGGFTYYQCLIQLNYESEWSHGIVKKLHYKITVGVPPNPNVQYRLTSGPLYNDCDCTIISDIKYRSRIFIGTSCDNEITSETTLNDGQYLCWEVIVEDQRKAGAELEIISIKETSVKTIEVIDAILLKCKAEAVICLKGRAYAIFRPSVSDWSELSMTLKFHSQGSSGSEVMNVKYSRASHGDSESSDDNMGAIIGGSAAGTLVIAIIIYFCCCRRKSSTVFVVTEDKGCCLIF